MVLGANPVMVLEPTTTFESPVVALKLLTTSLSEPLLVEVTVRAAAMPVRLPVLVGALELTLTVFIPPPVVTVVGALIDWMFALSLFVLALRSMETAVTPVSGTVTVWPPEPVSPLMVLVIVAPVIGECVLVGCPRVRHGEVVRLAAGGEILEVAAREAQR